MPAAHGFKAHVGADADTALVEEIAVTPANVNDGKAGPAALPDNPGEVFADSACQGRHFGEAIRSKARRAAHRRHGNAGPRRGKNAGASARLEPTCPSDPGHRIRGRIEKIFGTWKRGQGLRRMRWRGLAKAALQVRLTAIACNLERGLTIRAVA